MKRLFVHAGLHKTGTSAIQRYCHENSSFLLDYNIVYPSSSPFSAHHRLAARLKGSQKTTWGRHIESYAKEHWTGLPEECKVVISSEMFSEGVDPYFLNLFHDYFDQISVVFYLRRQDELLESAYNQQVKQNRETRQINDYNPYMIFLDRHLDWFQTHLRSSDKIIARVYDKRVFLGNSLLKDFLVGCLGIPTNNLNLSERDTQIVNSSLSIPACLLMSRLNRLNLTPSIQDDIIKVLLQYFSCKSFRGLKLLSDDAEDALHLKIRESNILLDLNYLDEPYFTLIQRRNLEFCSLSYAYSLARDSLIFERVDEVIGSSHDWKSIFGIH